ncbi:helix-turn-helix domain-containing protein [Bradyrhizobium sp. B117]|uniref:helix-turn-helix domain-containing protein n=1 Tax=Bradyrhizobium sp. B117 TaxID=3140246 RepID=UPI003183E256
MRRIRVERGIPQEQLANDAGIYRSYMGCIEQKKENPTIELLDRIAVPSGVHLSELFAEPVKDATPQARRKPARPLSEQEVIIVRAMFQLTRGEASRSGPHASSIYSRRFRSPAPADVVQQGSA